MGSHFFYYIVTVDLVCELNALSFVYVCMTKGIDVLKGLSEVMDMFLLYYIIIM